MMTLANRIIADNTCVIEGDLSELKEARDEIRQMIEEAILANALVDYPLLKRAERATTKYIERMEL